MNGTNDVHPWVKSAYPLGDKSPTRPIDKLAVKTHYLGLYQNGMLRLSFGLLGESKKL